MSSNEFGRSIVYSKEDIDREKKALYSKMNLLKERAEEIREEIESLKKEADEYGTVLRTEHFRYESNRKVIEKTLNKKREEIEKEASELNKLSRKIGDCRRRLDELEGKPTSNLIEDCQLEANRS